LIEQRLAQWFSDNNEKTTAQSQLDTLTVSLQQLAKTDSAGRSRLSNG